MPGTVKLEEDSYVLDPADGVGDIDAFFDLLSEDWANVDVVSDNGTESDMESFNSDPVAFACSRPSQSKDKSKGAVKSSTKAPIHKQAPGKGKLQRTRGEPCLLKVCQFPVHISNAINVGDIDLVNSTIDEFLTKECSLHAFVDNASSTVFSGSDQMKEYFSALLDLMPDLSCQVKAIKLRERQCVVFKMNFEGTFISNFRAENPFTDAFKCFFQKELLGIFDKYIAQITNAEELEKVVQLRDEVSANSGKHCYNKFQVTGRLMFHNDVVQYWDNNEFSPQGSTVDRLFLSCEISSVTPSSVLFPATFPTYGNM